MGFFQQIGLPIATDGLLGILQKDDKIIIIDESREFFLNLAQVKNIEYIVERETERELRTSTAKGIAGAVAFGAAGAVIGSQAKQKTIRDEITSSLIISYIDSNKEDSIIEFGYRTGPGDFTPNDMKKFETAIKKLIRTDEVPLGSTIEL